MPAILIWTVVALGALSSAVTQAQDSAEKAVRQPYTELSQKRLSALWEQLPPSYQRDVESVAHALARSLDERIHASFFTLLGRVERVLLDKQKFIAGHPLASGDPEQTALLTTALPAALKILRTSDLARAPAGTSSTSSPGGRTA